MRFLTAIATAVALISTPHTFAQTADHQSHHVAQAAPAELVEGEVRKVDKDAGKITLKHGELKNLEMPAMTMVFQVKDKSMLDQVKAGDKVRFTADKVGGAFTITHLEAAK